MSLDASLASLWRKKLAAGLALLLLSTLGACSAPQIPLPPPDIGDLSFLLVDAGQNLGQVQGSGASTPEMGGSTVRIVNLRDGHGVITPAADDGSFTTRPFVVRDGDELQIDYSVEAEASEGLCAEVRYGQPLRGCRR